MQDQVSVPLIGDFVFNLMMMMMNIIVKVASFRPLNRGFCF